MREKTWRVPETHLTKTERILRVGMPAAVAKPRSKKMFFLLRH
uniref:Uncharacterized protein n=1 Tax=Utricularia reniformis TaxID=192314 RepID=A0A1Y0B0P9_9LAMI|nr:hypothetical protein AEK19_MT0785 [Utricularia reniformis]ART31026.1 hypothetical protein AEK19_MT0785 [Utricularia reniformis]